MKMKETIHSGEMVLGAFLSEIPAPNLTRLMKASGLDFVIVDCEHGYFDYSQVAALAAVANGIGFPLVVRVPGISRECVQKYLDAGVDGLLVPMLETRRQAEDLVRYGKYAPEGARGISTMRPHSDYDPGRLTEYTAKANRRTLFFAQIETRTGVENAADIAAVPGLDGFSWAPTIWPATWAAPEILTPRRWRRPLSSWWRLAARRASPPASSPPAPPSCAAGTKRA